MLSRATIAAVDTVVGLLLLQRHWARKGRLSVGNVANCCVLIEGINSCYSLFNLHNSGFLGRQENASYTSPVLCLVVNCQDFDVLFQALHNGLHFVCIV